MEYRDSFCYNQFLLAIQQELALIRCETLIEELKCKIKSIETIRTEQIELCIRINQDIDNILRD